VVFGLEDGVAAHAETDNPIGRGILAHDADRETARRGQHAHDGATARRRALRRFGLRERVDRLGARPARLVQYAVDGEPFQLLARGEPWRPLRHDGRGG